MERLLELFVVLCRGADGSVIRQKVTDLVGRVEGNPAALVDLFTLAFQTRDCRGGKGERDLFRTLFLALYERFETETLACLPLVAEYGYFKDYVTLWAETETDPRYASLRDAVLSFYAETLLEDEKKVVEAVTQKEEPNGLTLAAKFAPRLRREKKTKPEEATATATATTTEATVNDTTKVVTLSHRRFGKALRDRMFPKDKRGSEKYRKLVSHLSERLRVVERLMSQGRWDEIDVGMIPSLCLARKRKAFLYEDKKGVLRGNDKARMKLREALMAPKNAAKIKGGQLFADELVAKCMGYGALSEGEKVVMDAQWESIKKTVQKQIDDFAAQQAAAAAAGEEVPQSGFSLGNVVPIVDVSGSMSGKPMEVAVAMGLLLAELNSPAFRNRVLTFSSSPAWFRTDQGDLFSRVRNLMRAPWGMSTNFEAAMNMIIGTLEQLATQTGEMPDVPELAVFSDMQFDVACNDGYSRQYGQWDTAYDRIQHNFSDLGLRLRANGVKGVPNDLKPPTITFWNIRDTTTNGLVAGATTKGVRLLSGYSQSLLKLLLSGALPPLGSVDDPTVPEPSPVDTLRAALDDNRYDEVRSTLAALDEGVFAEYSFTPAPKPEETPEEEDVTTTGGGKAVSE
jgi:uncharacterized protein with von Willebrand factor type A (vWA) domain